MAPTTRETSKVGKTIGEFPRFWAMLVIVGTIVGATIVGGGFIAEKCNAITEVHRHEAASRAHPELHEAMKERFDTIDKKLDRQWRVIRARNKVGQ